MTAALEPVREPPRRTPGERAFDVAIWGGLALLLIVGGRNAEIGKIGELFAGGENMRQLGSEFVQPNCAHYKLYVADMWLTIQMALWGTTLALIIAVPLGLAGSRNLAPPWVQQPVRRL